MEKSKSLMSRAYETPEIEEIMVETAPIMQYTGPGGGGMDDPSPEDPD